MNPYVLWIVFAIGISIVFLPTVIAAGNDTKIMADDMLTKVTLPTLFGLLLITGAAVKLFPTEASDMEKQALLIFALVCSAIVSLSSMFSSCVRIRMQGF
jgi:hypothetical protein